MKKLPEKHVLIKYCGPMSRGTIGRNKRKPGKPMQEKSEYIVHKLTLISET